MGDGKDNGRPLFLGTYMGCIFLLLISPQDRICAPSHRGSDCAGGKEAQNLGGLGSSPSSTAIDLGEVSPFPHL